MDLITEKWQEFKIKDIFDVELAKGDIKLGEVNSGDIPLVSSGESNNGIVGYIDSLGDGKSEMFPSNRITIDMFGNAFYQNEPFYAVSHGRVNILKPKFGLTRNIGLFISAIIKQEQYRFSYGRAVYSSVAEEMDIKLPVDLEGNPDWQFMEDYIKSLHHKPITTKRSNETSLQINTNNWEHFKVENLFSRIYKAKAHTKEEVTESAKGMNLVSRTEENNGIDLIVQNENLEGIEKGNCITIGDTTATCFYQKDEFITGDHMVVLRSDWMTQSTGLYIVTLINREKYRYCYGRAYKMDSIKSTLLKLPVKKDEQGIAVIDTEHKYHSEGFIPDWQYMEDYINSLPYSDRI
jgi:hypothetical protein